MSKWDLFRISLTKFFIDRLAAIGRNTKWHETYSKYAVGKMNMAQERKINAELGQANIELKTLRQKRLKE